MIRRAQAGDTAAVVRIVQAAYAPLAERMDKPPAPMLDDYAARIAEGAVDVLEEDGIVIAMIIVVARDDQSLLENVAVDPAHQGKGAGRRLIAHAEDRARAAGHGRITLYTHVTMVENRQMYAALGYSETGQGLEDGYDRVQFEKRLTA